jgi:hypothetical protein
LRRAIAERDAQRVANMESKSRLSLDSPRRRFAAAAAAEVTHLKAKLAAHTAALKEKDRVRV